MYQSTGGLAKLQAVLANRKYSYGGQLPSDVENQSKTENFGNMVGGGIDAMQRIFAGGRADRDSTSQGEEASIVASSTRDGNGMSGMSGIQRYQAIASRTSSGTADSSNNFSSNAPTYDDPSSSSSIPNGENKSNLDIAKDKYNMQDVNYKEILPYLEKMANRNFDRDANYAGLASLSNAFGKTGGFSTVFGSYNPR